ncbi:coproporphyrinogen III oxidase [Pedobacter sp. JY14-1]|uniref:coproporphyrinogen III oxidase n=1 Tax=Pedobacter sp. JY14-1 TaxID=3034151 RepID=UPI0023E17742|nr:coproporphyrinogen III oxidase [Pedobacter sp. JY14-1]
MKKLILSLAFAGTILIGASACNSTKSVSGSTDSTAIDTTMAPTDTTTTPIDTSRKMPPDTTVKPVQ